VLFFQVISTLAVIQSKYPSFRHNDLKANNILVHKINKKNQKFSYRIVRCDYIVPNIGFQLKLWDYDFACIPNVINNAKVEAEWTTKINIKPEQNRYYDIHYFFNTLSRKGFFPEFLTEPEIPEKVKELSTLLSEYLRKVGADRPLFKQTNLAAPWPDEI
jgi:serine/threonine protein kinase